MGLRADMVSGIYVARRLGLREMEGTLHGGAATLPAEEEPWRRPLFTPVLRSSAGVCTAHEDLSRCMAEQQVRHIVPADRA